ncbi:MAG TPA: diacylglycerol kinase family protein [Gaiellaceae bacterium]|nr:diacylglycerol kinase family protein [Gaiellaceae bacterium]
MSSFRDAIAIAGFLLINPRSGRGGPGTEELQAEAERRGIRTRLLSQGDDAAKLAGEADADMLGIAGGDGSLAPVAEVALERDVPFVCVPFGTRNHFARDVGLDRDDPLGALDAFGGVERRVDVGRVQDRAFLNNVSLGLYARLVHRRERHRRRRDALARLRAFGLLLRRPRPIGFTVEGDPIAARVLVVGNNRYSVELFSPGERERLDEGLLHLYTAEGVLPRTWEERSGTRFVVDTRRHRVSAAIDGEPEQLETPLEFTIEPQALRVLLPAG